MKEILLVYQDCPMCGSRKDWGDEQIAKARAKRASIRKVSFVSEEGRKYCAEALEAGKASMPFFTDGEGHFAKTVKELYEEIKPKRKAKKNVDKKQD